MAELLEVMKSALVDTRNYAGCQKVETFIDQESQKHIVGGAVGEPRASTGLYGLAGGNRIYGRGGGLFLDGALVARVFDIKSDI